jgi:hypothetical protein
MVYENEMNPTTQNQQGVCHDVALPFTLKSILRQFFYMETQIFDHEKI